jgi:regulator of sigma E protease
VGWLPLGGYCKIAGMIDESFDKEQMAQPEQPWEFRSKPAWQRLLIMIGGVLVNFLLALFIYSMVLFWWGDTYIPARNTELGMKFNKEAKALGFQDHDIIIAADGDSIKSLEWGSALSNALRAVSTANEVTVLRGGKEVVIKTPGNLDLLDMISETPAFAMPFMPALVDSVAPGSNPDKAGLRVGDTVVAVNGVAVSSWNEITDQIGIMEDVYNSNEAPSGAVGGASLPTATVVVRHQQAEALDTLSIQLTVMEKDRLALGAYFHNPYTDYKKRHVDYNFFSAFPAGIAHGARTLGSYVSDLKYVFTSKGFKSLGGFGAIGSLFPATWDWHRFWEMTAFLSIILAFMNILPIPALDGGHVLFLCYEIVTRRKPSEDFMIKAEYVGFGILILLMVVANLNDVLRWLGVM